MQISTETFNMMFVCAIIYLIARRVQDKFREERGIAKSASNIDLSGLTIPYLKAVIAGAVFVFVMWEFIPGSPIADMAGEGLPSWAVRIAVFMSIIPLVMITTPFVLLAGLAIRALKIRRGVADISTGIIGATLGPLGSALFGPQSMEMSEAIPFIAAFPFAGAVGGFVFWRALKYPGLQRSTARKVERSSSGAETLGDVAGGSVLGVGLAVHAMLRDKPKDGAETRPKPRRCPKPANARTGFGKRAT